MEDLKQTIEQYESLEAEKAHTSDIQKQVLAGAKAQGYDVAAIRKVIALRKKTREQREEEAAIVDLYMSAVDGAK